MQSLRSPFHFSCFGANASTMAFTNAFPWEGADGLTAIIARVRGLASVTSITLNRELVKTGDDYSKLKQVIVLMIMPYDPFGKDRVLYTIRSRCEEEPDMEYDDGAVTCFFYTKGKKGELSGEARL